MRGRSAACSLPSGHRLPAAGAANRRRSACRTSAAPRGSFDRHGHGLGAPTLDSSGQEVLHIAAFDDRSRGSVGARAPIVLR